MAMESLEGILTEALHVMQEAWFLIAPPAGGALWHDRHREALAVLEQGIAQARDALHLTDPLEKLR